MPYEDYGGASVGFVYAAPAAGSLVVSLNPEFSIIKQSKACDSGFKKND
jgi:hypothetical protein